MSRDPGRQYPDRPIVGVGAVILVTGAGRSAIGLAGGDTPASIVLVKRRFAPLAGEWSLPGGAVELGETLDAAVARETLEETGLAIDVGPVVEVFDRILVDDARRVQYHFVLIDYVCRPVGGRLTAGSDVSDVVLADPDALDRYRLTEKARAVIARALEITWS